MFNSALKLTAIALIAAVASHAFARDDIKSVQCTGNGGPVWVNTIVNRDHAASRVTFGSPPDGTSAGTYPAQIGAQVIEWSVGVARQHYYRLNRVTGMLHLTGGPDIPCHEIDPPKVKF
jgi:hypothetical protein